MQYTNLEDYNAVHFAKKDELDIVYIIVYTGNLLLQLYLDPSKTHVDLLNISENKAMVDEIQ